MEHRRGVNRKEVWWEQESKADTEVGIKSYWLDTPALPLQKSFLLLNHRNSRKAGDWHLQTNPNVLYKAINGTLVLCGSYRRTTTVPKV